MILFPFLRSPPPLLERCSGGARRVAWHGGRSEEVRSPLRVAAKKARGAVFGGVVDACGASTAASHADGVHGAPHCQVCSDRRLWRLWGGLPTPRIDYPARPFQQHLRSLATPVKHLTPLQESIVSSGERIREVARPLARRRATIEREVVDRSTQAELRPLVCLDFSRTTGVLAPPGAEFERARSPEEERRYRQCLRGLCHTDNGRR